MKRKEIVIDCEMDFSVFESSSDENEIELMKCRFYEDGKYIGDLDYKLKVEDGKVRSIIRTNLPPEYVRAFYQSQY